MNIEQLAVSALRPYPKNARTHSRKQLRQIAKSIERFGFCNPVLIDDDGQIIAGHGRVEAARLLEIKELPTVRLSHLSEDDKRAYVLADNKLAEKAGWDRETLAIELQHLIDVDFDVALTGFEPAEIDLLMEDLADVTAAEDESPDYPKGPAVSRADDFWCLGKHRLLCRDARDAAAYDLLMGGEKADFVFSDPPFNLKVNGHVSGLGRIRHAEFAMASGEMSREQFTAFLKTIFEQLCRHSEDGSIHQVCIDWRHMREMFAAGDAAYHELKQLCVWNKRNAGMGTFYRSRHELIFVWKHGEAPHINNFELGQHGRSRSNVWDYEGVNSFRAGRKEELAMHPTVKPVALVADAIKDCSRRGDLVLDPFAGSGTILIAAERTGRRARALEIDPGYVDVAIRRWEAFTGKKARLAPLDDSFEEVAEQRCVKPSVA
jgi:DNA modification methylase